jgi:hypothetical protein
MKGTNGCRGEVAVLARLARVGLGVLVAFLVISNVCAPANLTAAAPGDSAGYAIAWWTVDGGGVNARQDASLTYVLGDSIGQPDAAVWAGGGYVLAGGFWGGDVVEHEIYLPLILKGM